MSFVQRAIDITFHHGTGPYGDSGYDTLKLSGYRVSLSIENFGSQSMGQAEVRIYGLSISIMNQLSTLGNNRYALRNNSIAIEVGDSVSGMTKIYEGTIISGVADFRGAPDVSFTTRAMGGYYAAMKPAPPSSFAQATDVATILKGIASQMTDPLHPNGLTFENNGVSVMLPISYFPGTLRQQAYAAAEAASIEMVIDNGTLAIWNRGSFRGTNIGTVSPQSGLVGYPSFTSVGIAFRTLFFQTLCYGSRLTMQSSLTGANGDWIVYKLTYLLDAQIDNGNWFQDCEAYRPGDIVTKF